MDQLLLNTDKSLSIKPLRSRAWELWGILAGSSVQPQQLASILKGPPGHKRAGREESKHQATAILKTGHIMMLNRAAEAERAGRRGKEGRMLPRSPSPAAGPRLGARRRRGDKGPHSCGRVSPGFLRLCASVSPQAAGGTQCSRDAGLWPRRSRTRQPAPRRRAAMSQVREATAAAGRAEHPEFRRTKPRGDRGAPGDH